MKKVLKKILALVATGAMAVSAFAMSASAAAHNIDPYGYCANCGVYHTVNGYDYDYWFADSYLVLTADQYNGGSVEARVQAPAGVTVDSYTWSGDVNTATTSETTTITATNGASFSATCTVTYHYTVGTTGNSNTYSRTVSATVRGIAYPNSTTATNCGAGKVVGYSYGNGYYPGYIYDDDIVYYNGAYYYYWQGTTANGSWHPYAGQTPIDWYDYNYPSYVKPSRYDYEVDWDTDTFYYNGRKQVPTATVTIGKRTIELDVRIIAGDKDSTDVGSYRASASLPSGYRGYKLSGSTIRYTIEEPLKQGLVNENGGVYYYTNGKAATGWKTIGNDTYYFGKDGKATVGWIKLEGKWYYFDTAGIMQTGWVRSGGKTYYTNASGVMVASKWMKLDGYWYYFGETGAMVESGWVQTGGKWYYLSADGKMATNTTIPGGYRVDANGVWVK